jgi:hypothetical protein
LGIVPATAELSTQAAEITRSSGEQVKQFTAFVLARPAGNTPVRADKAALLPFA